jgi:RNA-binding protein YhbY
MEHILHESIIPYLQTRFDLHDVIKVRVLHCSGLGEGAIDEKIGDLETLINPTVGLAAHTGVVDVRIAAKAASETEADKLIAHIENDIRSRLGDAVFGVDEDSLEEVVLEAFANRGWKLVAVELGLGGLLARHLPQTISLPDLKPADLMAAVRTARTDFKADVALGICVYPDDRSAEMVLITSHGEKTHRVTYGGPPRSLSLWAMNLALNWLRTTARELV